MQNLTELQALQNAANNLNLVIHEKFNQDKRKRIKLYFAQRGNETISPNLDYYNLNHFLLGYSRCKKEAEVKNIVRTSTIESISKKIAKQMFEALNELYNCEEIINSNALQSLDDDIDYLTVNYFCLPPDGDNQHNLVQDIKLSDADAINLMAVRIENTIK